MKKFMKKCMNNSRNKGFSLVELIIVIAIMAILMGVVGSQVIPYLEKSRQATDNQLLSTVGTSAVSAFATQAGHIDAGADYDLTLNTSSETWTTSHAGQTEVLNDLRDFLGVTGTNLIVPTLVADMDSTEGGTLDHITIHYAGATTGVVTVTAFNAAGDQILEIVESK